MKNTKAKQIPDIKPRHKFDGDFKRDAVLQWLNSGKSARQVAEDLGIGESRLHLWKKTHGPVGPAVQARREDELAALRRENAQLRQQRDILKKTLGILSEPPSNASNASRL
jgi:transposase